MALYVTEEYDGYGKQNYYHYEYELEGSTVVKYRVGRQKVFDGHESEWRESRKEVESWNVDDESLPEWLRQYL